MREPGKVYLINEFLPVKLSLESCTFGFVIIYRSAIWTPLTCRVLLLLILTSFSFILLHSSKIFPFSLHVSSSKPASQPLSSTLTPFSLSLLVGHWSQLADGVELCLNFVLLKYNLLQQKETVWIILFKFCS